MAFFRFSDFDPVSGLLSLQRELERVFENPLGAEFGPLGRGVFPPMNVFSDRDGYVLKLEAPGMDPANLNVESHGRTLHISGRREPKVPEGGSFHRRERGTGDFARSVQLPADLDTGAAEASYKHGILTIRIPKREEAKPRQISVKAA